MDGTVERQISVLADDILKNVEYDALRIVFNKFHSVVQFIPTVSTVLSPEVVEREAETGGRLGELDAYEIEGGETKSEILQNLSEFQFSCISVLADDILKNVEYDALRIVFNKFHSVVQFIPTVSTVLSPEVVEREAETGGRLGELDAYEIEGGETKSEILQNLSEFQFSCISVLADDILKNVEYDALRIVFNKFHSVVQFIPTVSTVLSPEVVEREAETGGRLGELDAYEIEGGETKSEILQNLSEFQFSCISVLADDILKNVEYDALRIVFNKFHSVVQFIPTVSTVLSPEVVEREAETGGRLGELDAYEIEGGETKSEILQNLSEFQFSCVMFNAVLENACSEQGARMSAMDSSSRNAGDMLDRLTLTYNRTRQASITTELIEIISGASALTG